MTNMEDCPKYVGCDAPVCPLYERLESTYNIDGKEPYCSYMLAYCEGESTPIDDDLKKTERIWRKILGKYIEHRLESRKSLRRYWKDRKTPKITPHEHTLKTPIPSDLTKTIMDTLGG